MTFPTWPDEQTARLKELWSRGYSASEIGGKLGISRNAVLGKAHRIKLERRRDPNAPRAERKRRVAAPHAPRPVAVRRGRKLTFVMSANPTKTDLRNMLRQAVINTGGV